MSRIYATARRRAQAIACATCAMVLLVALAGVSSPVKGDSLLVGGFGLGARGKSTPSTKKTVRPVVKLTKKSARQKKTMEQKVNAAARKAEITVSKSGEAFNRKASKPKWRYVTRSVRSKIDAPKLTPGRWRMIVIHSSATNEGSAKAFDHYHRTVRGMEHGLAYHFVIGNGNGSGDGEVQTGPRWSMQQAGGHLRSDAQNEIAVGICLVGDFMKRKPSRAQTEALDELIDYLQSRLGKIRVTTHQRINVTPTLCPGNNFPTGLFVEP